MTFSSSAWVFLYTFMRNICNSFTEERWEVTLFECWILGTGLTALWILSNLNLTTTLYRSYYYLHFIDKKKKEDQERSRNSPQTTQIMNGAIRYELELVRLQSILITSGSDYKVWKGMLSMLYDIFCHITSIWKCIFYLTVFINHVFPSQNNL